MSIGSNIFDLRKANKLTQSQLAEKLGVTEQSVSKWENDICSPDVSLFPSIAKLFGVSIDRLFGFHIDSYFNEVEKIIKAADDSMDTYREIQIISDGLKKYPNSDKLKIYLSFSLSMVNRISKDENERKEAVDKAISLCNEVVATSGDSNQIDDALNMLSRIYTEIGAYDKAIDSVIRISADKYYYRIVGIASVLANKKEINEQLRYVENALFDCWLAMTHILEGLEHGLLHSAKDPQKALHFSRIRKKLLEVFDEGGSDFYATYKMQECEMAAQIYLKLGNKDKCLDELEKFFELADDVRKVAKSKSLNIADRNYYFKDISDKNILEEYMSDVYPGRALNKYDEFLKDEPRYGALKEL